MSTLFVRPLREDPADAEVASHKLLVRGGYVRRVAPGIYSWLPLGLKVLARIERVIREEMDRAGSQEVHFPALLPREPYEATGRWEDYGPTLFKLRDRKDADYLLAPTHEEMFALLVKDLYSSYRDLPLSLYQIQTKYRDEARPRAGVIRGREFVMKDAYSFDIDEAGLDASYNAMREAYQRIFDRLGLPYVICSAVSAEADPSCVGEPFTVRTPGASTIEALVRDVNAAAPREDRPWRAQDTLKNVVVVAVQPDGAREVFVVGLPGDREVDLRRVEAALAPAEVDLAGPEDLAAYPELVPGYIGPQVLGPQSSRRGDRPRYLLDPRIARGSRWVTGANQADTHVVDLVYGRDFEADGTIEAAEIRDGDQAPDGSGPLRLARGVEIGHIFQLGRKYAQALGLTVLDRDGRSVVVTMGSYGIGVTRVLAALAEANHDDRGLAWPVGIAPADVHILATGRDDAVFDAAGRIARDAEAAGVDVLYDDRRKVSAGVKFADYELLGMPWGVVVGRGLAEGRVEIRNRRTGERTDVPVEQAPARLRSLIADE